MWKEKYTKITFLRSHRFTIWDIDDESDINSKWNLIKYNLYVYIIYLRIV